MTSRNKSVRSAYAPAARLVMERTYRTDIGTAWDLWTTPEGIEAWWGPSGFEVKVRKLDLRPGGQLLYAMTATAPAQVDFVTRAGLPVTLEARITYTEVVPQRRLAYRHHADFIPGVAPYDVATTVDLYPSGDNVRMVLAFDAMHDEQWTQRAVKGWESEFLKLAKVLGK
jgi:uncharacterized protein YndB with AHSA1/START domain